MEIKNLLFFLSRCHSDYFNEFWNSPGQGQLTRERKMHIHVIVDREEQNGHTALALFPLPCACQSLRRLTRLVTRIYDQELRKADIEVTQFGLLTGLAALGEANQKTLSAGFAMDSTTLTRTLALLRRQGWISIKRGKDRRERVLRLTEAGKRRLATAQPYWQEAERRLKQTLGDRNWKLLQSTIYEVTVAAAEA